MDEHRQSLKIAVSHHQAGRLGEAEAIYREILAHSPEQPDALHFLGVIALQTGQPEAAVDMIEQAIALNPDSAPFHTNLGNAFQALDRIAAAADSFRRAIELDPATLGAQSNLCNTLRLLGQCREAVAAGRRATGFAPDSKDAHYNLGLAEMELGETDSALASFRRVMELDPAHVQCHYLVCALSGEAIDSVPAEFVAELFNTHADQFDEHLTKNLGYRTPQALHDAVLSAAGPDDGDWAVLDLGCGTGLCGPLFRPRARHLIGSDLAGRMIDKARAREVYDELFVEDLIQTLGRAQGQADLVIAADVFVYLGDLAPTFKACARALGPGGLFAFSTEDSAGEGFELLRSARFAHARSYILSLAETHGFEMLSDQEAVLRTERDQPVKGRLYVFRRPDRERPAP